MKTKLINSLSIAVITVLFSTSAFAQTSYFVNCDSHSPLGDKVPQSLKMEMSGGNYSAEVRLRDMSLSLSLVEGVYNRGGRDILSISIAGDNDKGFSYSSTKVTLNDSSTPLEMSYYRAPTDLGISLSCWVSKH